MVDLNNLKKYGIDVEEVERKFKNDIDFYIKSIKEFPEDKNFEKMQIYINNNDYKSAYEHAKILKRIVGTLHFYSFYNNLRTITDLLRPCEPVNTTEALLSLKADYENILKAISLVG
ncbi:MAG: hypothetical protein GXZ13_04525 [Synergistaceae bacterium]|jgi:hypothetical protein|nr:hypothetical protein [Synergistaceae bacterium]